MRWLILFPLYFFTAMSLLVVLRAGVRVVRRDADLERLVGPAVFGALALVAVPLAAGVVSIEEVTLVPVLGLAALSFVLAGVDALLVRTAPDDPSHDDRDRARPGTF